MAPKVRTTPKVRMTPRTGIHTLAIWGPMTQLKAFAQETLSLHME